MSNNQWSPPAAQNAKSTLRVAAFEVDGERFSAWVTNPRTIQQLLELQQGTSRATIPSGRLQRGPGQAQHNTPWSWHLDPEDVTLAEFTIGTCDGTPSYIEEHLDEFVDTVQRFCPWNAKLVELRDYRGETR